MKEINLETILLETFQSRKETFYRNFSITESFLIQEAMKKACRQTLELAAENAEVKFSDKEVWSEFHQKYIYPTTDEVDEQSILNTINQIK